ncbi:MAG: hypothetical protein ABSG51_12630 [Terracidiphilus sp.]
MTRTLPRFHAWRCAGSTARGNAKRLGPGGLAASRPNPALGVWVRGSVMMVMVVMVLRGKRRGGKHRQKQGGEEKLFHGLNVARTPRVG